VSYFNDCQGSGSWSSPIPRKPQKLRTAYETLQLTLPIMTGSIFLRPTPPMDHGLIGAFASPPDQRLDMAGC
jgi:hypothetical protein